RPGRIDQAIEVPLPDEACRRRLISLYSQGLILKLTQPEDLVSRTKGASAAFIKELMRRAMLLACVDGSGNIIEDRHIDEALKELILSGSLTRRLLGFGAEE